jgi:hypothetical protein
VDELSDGSELLLMLGVLHDEAGNADSPLDVMFVA